MFLEDSTGTTKDRDMSPNTKIFLTEEILAKRWGMSKRTLQRWRWDWPRKQRGPAWTKFGGAVRYDLDVIEEYEARQNAEGCDGSDLCESN